MVPQTLVILMEPMPILTWARVITVLVVLTLFLGFGGGAPNITGIRFGFGLLAEMGMEVHY